MPDGHNAIYLLPVPEQSGPGSQRFDSKRRLARSAEQNAHVSVVHRLGQVGENAAVLGEQRFDPCKTFGG